MKILNKMFKVQTNAPQIVFKSVFTKKVIIIVMNIKNEF
jgi:hypothetical protein